MTVSLAVYDSSGLLVRSLAAGTASGLIGAATLSQSPYDPGGGPLLLSQGTWVFAFDGLDASGSVLRNGIYLFVIHSQAAGAAEDDRVQVQVLGQGAPSVVPVVAPEPALVGGGGVQIHWSPVEAAQLRLYTLDGALVRDLGVVRPPVSWDLRDAGGAWVAPGIYLLSVRVPGQREGRLVKLAVSR